MDKNIQKIKPSGIFTNYIYKAIPLAFDESMSYYETLCGILSLLKTQEEVINNNADLLAELELYVQNYFKNLDVQTEINNKLDEMAENGTLEELIAQYVNLSSVLAYNTVADMKNATNLVNGSFVKTYGLNSLNDGGGAFYKIRNVTTSDIVDNIKIIPINDTLIAELIENNNVVCFNNVNEMKNATNLVNGSFAKTYGYYNINDGGSAFYKIRNITNDDVIDNATLIAINNTLVAELIYNELNVKQLGAYGDNTHDDTNIFKIAVSKMTSGKKIYVPVGNYLITESLVLLQNIEDTMIYGDNLSSTLNFNLTEQDSIAINMVANQGNYIRCTLKNLYIKNLSVPSLNCTGLKLQYNLNTKIIENVVFNYFYKGVETLQNYTVEFDRLQCKNGTYGFINTSGVFNLATFKNCRLLDNTDTNLLLKGENHLIESCDLSNSVGGKNLKLTYCHGVTLNSNYFDCTAIIPIEITLSESIVFNGQYIYNAYDGNGNNITFDIDNVKGIIFNGLYCKCPTLANQNAIKLSNISYVTVNNSKFTNYKNAIYVYGQNYLTINNNDFDGVTIPIKTSEYAWAIITGNILSKHLASSQIFSLENTTLNVIGAKQYGTTIPTSEYSCYIGQTFFNTATNKLYVYNGSTWIQIN